MKRHTPTQLATLLCGAVSALAQASESISLKLSMLAVGTVRVDGKPTEQLVPSPGNGGTASVLDNDTNGGALATTTNSAVTVSNNGGIAGLTVNASGQLVVPTNTPAGNYTVTYQLCSCATRPSVPPAIRSLSPLW